MKEDFLSFIWKFQYFDKKQLKTTNGGLLQILNPGTLNTNSGPDFSNAHVKVGGMLLAGPVEIHVRASDWNLHRHHHDPAYDQVVLHVVWVNNKTVKTSSNQEMLTLELKDRVKKELLFKYLKSGTSNAKIPCEGQLDRISSSSYNKMLDQAIQERIRRKSQEIITLLKRYSYDWDLVSYLVLGRNFGFHINTVAFETLVAIVPLSIVRKIRPNLFQLESLFFGQAGFLQRITGDRYYRRLQKEYEFLEKKYCFRSTMMKKEMWKYLRLRPSNFPSLRIAQFASIMHHQDFRFSDIRESATADIFRNLVVQTSPYWNHHYDFGKKWEGGSSSLGKSSRENLIINTAVPMLVAYAVHTGQSDCHVRAIGWMKDTPPEHNHMITYWKDKGFEVPSAYHSQAIIELNTQYCNLRKCLGCAMGQSLLAGISKL